MNLTPSATREQLADLLAGCNPAASPYVLWVKHTGDVAVASLPKGQSLAGFARNHADLAMGCEIALPEEGAEPPPTANDPSWVVQVFDWLTYAWIYRTGLAGLPHRYVVGAVQPPPVVCSAGRLGMLLWALCCSALTGWFWWSPWAGWEAPWIYYPVTIAGAFVTLISLLYVLSPPRLEVAMGTFRTQGLGKYNLYSWTDNLHSVDHDGQTLRITFANLDGVYPAEARADLKRHYQRHQAHLTVEGFTLAQAEDLRRVVGLPPPSPATPAGRTEATLHALRALTPRALVTPVLIAVNVALFALMLWWDGLPQPPAGTASLVSWGAQVRPLVTEGQGWRLASSMFLHMGVLHLLMNMFALAIFGLLAERLFGSIGFTVLYVASGLIGNVLELYGHPVGVSGGASGAVLGVAGGLIGFLVVRHATRAPLLIRGELKRLLVVMALQLATDQMIPGIAWGAHLGGALAGFVLGLILGLPLGGLTRRSRAVRNLLCAAVGGLAVVLPLWHLPRSPVDDEGWRFDPGLFQAKTLSLVQESARPTMPPGPPDPFRFRTIVTPTGQGTGRDASFVVDLWPAEGTIQARLAMVFHGPVFWRGTVKSVKLRARAKQAEITVQLPVLDDAPKLVLLPTETQFDIPLPEEGVDGLPKVGDRIAFVGELTEPEGLLFPLLRTYPVTSAYGIGPYSGNVVVVLRLQKVKLSR